MTARVYEANDRVRLLVPGVREYVGRVTEVTNRRGGLVKCAWDCGRFSGWIRAQQLQPESAIDALADLVRR